MRWRIPQRFMGYEHCTGADDAGAEEGRSEGGGGGCLDPVINRLDPYS